MTNEERFIAKSKEFRLHFKLTEDDVDALLANKNLKYKGLEIGTKTLTLELAEAYPLIYGIEYCDFKKEDTTPPEFKDLPQFTQDYITNRPEKSGNKVGLKGTKNMASYVIRAIKDYPLGYQFMNVEVLTKLPYPLNEEATITWNYGLLKGLVKSTKKFKSYKGKDGKTKRAMIYEVVKAVDKELLDKSMKNVDDNWLKKIMKKKKK